MKKPRKSAAGRTLLIAAVLLLTAAAVQFIYLNGFIFAGGAERRMTDTEKGVTYDFDAGAAFYSHDSRFFYFCTRDGMKYVSSNGETRWQEMFNLTKPLMDARGDMVAVGEHKGRHIYLFDDKGLLYSVPFEDPVLYFSVSPAGYLTVILQLDRGYDIRVYGRRDGGALLYQNISRDTLLLPTAADVSEDGRYVAIAWLDINLRMNARATFYYLNEQDALRWPTEDGLFASEDDHPGQIIYHIKFMDDNNALVVSDTQIACYQPGDDNTLRQQWVIPLHNRIDLLTFYKGSRFAFITGNKLLNDENASEPGEVNIYDVAGRRTGGFSLGRRGTYLSMGHNALIAGADRSFYALSHLGGLLWEYIAIQDTRAVIFLDNTDTALMAGGDRAAVLKRARPKASAAPAEIVLEEP